MMLALNPRAVPLERGRVLQTGATISRVESVYHALRQHHTRINDRWTALFDAARRGALPDDWAHTPFVHYVACLNGRLMGIARVLEWKIRDILPQPAVVDRVCEVEVNGRAYAYYGAPFEGGAMWVRYTWPGDDVVRVVVAP